MSERIEIRAPAKINLFLRVGPRRADGYHPIASWICAIGLSDTLSFQCLPRPSFELSSNQPQLSCGPDNLILRAAHLLAQAAAARPSATPTGWSIQLHKRIPVGAGLGGGSSDAATTLATLNRLWNLELPTDQLHDLAARLGSDVPFFLNGPSALSSGRGELLQPLPAPSPRGCILIFPDFPLSTAQVYARFDELSPSSPTHAMPSDDRLLAATRSWTSLPAAELLPCLFNDLEPAAFSLRPELQSLQYQLQQRLGRPVRMSGSGSTLFTLADQMDEAQNIVRKIRQYELNAMAMDLATEKA